MNDDFGEPVRLPYYPPTEAELVEVRQRVAAGLVSDAPAYCVWVDVWASGWRCIDGSDDRAEAERLRREWDADLVLPRGELPSGNRRQPEDEEARYHFRKVAARQA